MARAKKFGDPLIEKIAAAHGKSEAQIMIRWSFQLGYITIPKSVTEQRIIDNADVFDFSLSGALTAQAVGTELSCATLLSCAALQAELCANSYL